MTKSEKRKAQTIRQIISLLKDYTITEARDILQRANSRLNDLAKNKTVADLLD